MGNGPKAHVVVVGAGLAGLTAAYRLGCAGARVTLLEASGAAGGRLRGEALDGVQFDPGLHALPESAPRLFGLARELGVSRSLRSVALDRVGILRGTRVELSSTRTGDVLRGHPLRGPRLRRVQNVVGWLGSQLDPAAPERTPRLDDRSIADFARVYLGRRVRDRLLVPLFETCFGLDAYDTTRELLFCLLEPDGSPGVSLGFGLWALARTLVGRFARLPDAELRCDARVVSVHAQGRGVRLEQGADIAADAVLLAVPGIQAAKLFPDPLPAERDALETLRYTNALHLAVLLDAGAAKQPPVSWVPRSEGGELAGMIDVPHDDGAVRLRLLVARPTLFSRHGHRTDEDLAGLLLESAERLQRGIGRELRAQRLLRLEQILPSFTVGRYRANARLLAGIASQPARRVFLCGDYLIAPHAEGAIASGERAAEAVLSAPAARS